MFVRVCPYFPFSARVCLNQHDWLARGLRQRAIRFRQCSNAFLSCSHPEALQQLADSLTADDLMACSQKWLTRFTPFFTAAERQHAGVQHRLFFAQTEYCDNSSSVVAPPSRRWSNASWTPIAPSVSPAN